MPSQIDVVYSKMVNDIVANPILERSLQMNLQKLNHFVQMHFIQKHEEGYCGKFAIPDREINLLFIDFPSLTNEEINNAFIKDWNVPSSANMHTNLYYHRLLLIALYGARKNKDELALFALKLLLYRIWNGRLCKLIKWCNPEIMAAAIASLTDNRMYVKKYATPLDLIQNFFAPSIYTKYKSYLINDGIETKRVFEQCYNRVKQLFGSNSRKDLVTGETKYQTGIQPAYYKAHENKNKIVKNRGELEFEDKFTTSNADELIETVTSFITLSRQVRYSPEFVSMVSQNIKGLKSSTVPLILSKIHQIKYNDLIREIIELYFRRLRGITETELCSSKFFASIKTRIIASKNTQDVDFLKRLSDKLLDNIFKDDLDKSYTDYMTKTDNQRSQYKIIIFYGIAYNIQRALCEYK